MNKEFFPDGTPIDDWFYNEEMPVLENMGKEYLLTDYNIFDDGKVYTDKIQLLIDHVSENGGRNVSLSCT